MDKLAIVEIEENPKGALTLRAREFKTGSKGYMIFGKLTIDGKRYQVMGNVVEIGSKPKEEA